MPAERYFIEKFFIVNESYVIEDQEFHHLIHVMRSRENDEIELMNGMGQLAKGILEKICKKQASVRIHSIQTEPKPSFEIILAQAIPRINRLDFILEKGTELGMTQIWLFPGHLSERKELSQHQIERMKGIVVAAAKQCGRLFIPKIEVKPALDKWKTLSFTAFYGDVDMQAPLFTTELTKKTIVNGIAFFVGPESGFSDKENSCLKALGAEGVKLHPNILRTDTASLVALSFIGCSKPFTPF